MRSKLFVWTAFGVLAAFAGQAQDINEALNLSNTTVQGTARSIGFGGALGSVGGDFSALSVNPAGIGVYRSSELSFTPSFKINSSSSDFLGVTTNDNNVRLNINNFGVVFTDAPRGKRYERRKWKAASFGLGVNRVADFNHDYTYTGVNNKSSASQAFEADANYDSLNLFSAGASANIGNAAGLLIRNYGIYNTIVPFSGGITQLNTVRERGGINEYTVSLGGNYQEKLLVGITIGIPHFSYTRNSDYSETVVPGNAANPWNFQSFNYSSKIDIQGTGANVKLGAIYKITDYLRIGAAFHSPTYYSLSDVTDYGISSNVSGILYNVSTANDFPQRVFNYTFTTPVKGVLSATLILKKFGFITADYEYVDYNTMRFRYPDGIDKSTGLSFAKEASDMNQVIKNTYQGASNFRVGAEVKVAHNFMVRGGFGYYSNPYKDAAQGSERMDISAGLGYRTGRFFADVALVSSSYQFKEQAYSQADYNYVYTGREALPPIATVRQNVANLAFSIGTKF